MRHADLVPRYAIALLSVTLAFVLKWAIDPVSEEGVDPFLFFSGAVAVSAWYGGLLPGLAALGLATITATVAFLPPIGHWLPQGAVAAHRVLAFVLEGQIICLVCHLMHRARARAESSSSEAREALRARRTSEARFRRLAESGVIGVIEGREEAIVEANDAFLRTLNYDRDRLAGPGLPVAEITPEAQRRQDDQRFDELFRVGTLEPFEKEYLTADGRRVPVLVGGALVEPGGPDWVAFVLDLSRQKAAERELAEAIGRAEAASRAKSQFLAVLSHELITPMNAILGMNQLAMAGERDPTLRDYLATAQESAEALLALLNDLLDYSSIEVGGVELDPAPFRLRPTIDRIVRPMATRASRKGLELTAEVAADVPDALVGDARRLRQVLVNLLDNAIKFTRQGEVSVAVALDPEPAADGGPVVRFEVADTGIGIPEGDRERIFSPFTQIDASSTRPYSGTGLGLAICRQIAALMGGRIDLRSEPGRGSRFCVSVPLRRQAGAADSGPEEGDGEQAAPGLAGLPVLVVDDSPSNRRIVESILAGWSMRPVAAPDGPAALALLAEASGRGEPFPIVLLDAQMPGLDGFAVAARIHRERLAGAAVLMQSPADRDRSPDRRDAPGIAATLEKPVTPPRLLEAIVSALGAPAPPVPEPGEPGPTPRPLHILLAEDTPANQKLTLSVLRRRGHLVDLAANGREAVELAARRRYDLVLMDVQMPVMDGLQATAAIRSKRGDGDPDVPIVALTAHALRGDRRRCLQAGMDDYIAKPIDVPAFLTVVESYAPRAERPPRPPAPGRPAGAGGDGGRATGGQGEVPVDDDFEPAPYDRPAALRRLGGDEELFGDMIGFFLEDYPGLLDQLRRGLLSDDARAVERAAHSLKGLAANCGSGPAVEAAGRVEQIGRDGRLAEAPEAVERLVAELQRLRDALAADRCRASA